MCDRRVVLLLQSGTRMRWCQFLRKMGRAASSSVTTLATSRARLSWVRLKLPRRMGMSRIAAPSRFIDASRSSMIRSTGLVAEAPAAMSTPPVLLDQLRLEPLGLGGDDPQGELAAAQRGADLVDPGDGPVPLVALPPGPGLGVLGRPLGLGEGVADLLEGLPELGEPGQGLPVRPAPVPLAGGGVSVAHRHRSDPLADRE